MKEIKVGDKIMYNVFPIFTTKSGITIPRMNRPCAVKGMVIEIIGDDILIENGIKLNISDVRYVV